MQTRWNRNLLSFFQDIEVNYFKDKIQKNFMIFMAESIIPMVENGILCDLKLCFTARCFIVSHDKPSFHFLVRSFFFPETEHPFSSNSYQTGAPQ